jgi:hypothetical protein
MHLRDLTIETAKPLEGTTFQVTFPDGRTTRMTLNEVLPFERPGRRHPRARAGAPLRAPFSLYFLGDPSIVLPQGMYTLASDAETLENVFIVPIGQDSEATEYEAVFA